VEIRTDRVGLLLDQLDTSLEISRARLAGMSDEEYLWEPTPGAWSVRRRGEQITPDAYGPGDYVLDLVRQPDVSSPTTIAWRLGHLLNCFAGRWEWTFGSRSVPPEDIVEFTPSADTALDQLWFQVERWRRDVDTLSPDQLDTVGFGQYPWGLDAKLPIIGIVWWLNREFIHHAAEVALLRDLWPHRPGAAQ
jgi:hypothetical protein